jgi:cytochrome c oxidase cbb3-type subunit 3
MRRSISRLAIILIPAIYFAGFLAMSWVRSRQGHAEPYPSEIDTLAAHKAPSDPLADARARGQKVFTHYCQICHGESGKGDGFNAGKLTPPPRDFSDAKFWNSTTDERVHFAVTRGGQSVGKSVLMPAWGQTLTKPQIDDVIIYIRAFASPPSTASGAK